MQVHQYKQIENFRGDPQQYHDRALFTALRGLGYVGWNYEWRVIHERGDERSSIRTFSTFRECVAVQDCTASQGIPIR